MLCCSSGASIKRSIHDARGLSRFHGTLTGNRSKTLSRVPRAFSDASSAEPARYMPLPSGVWLLDYLQDKFYDIRGPNFTIRRTESEVPQGMAHRRVRRPLVPTVREQEQLGMIHKVVWNHPGSTMLLEGATVDITELLEACPEEHEEAWSTTVNANTTCTGIVPVPQETASEEECGQEVYYTNSTSPRRTKMVGFTCKCCGARNFSSVNPISFNTGTLVAQCAKCERWHKLSDHLGLFHQLEGPLFRGADSKVTMEDVPPSLRILDPFYWQQDEPSDD